ncbi:ornithine cyclodeaminase/alanine dehydrogenase-like protein (mu-crystallin family) [Novosphingobium chloroacetimidivorans]|uniref:Ornithine cyclodeaminase/alanine dehydrogenase-like protein (Mu-crystallin family) n=1 Tax=Novosphingobium chloroacetimidivorans TaxID=1428314 RepID=A0A7W7K9V5_9SPHN|nr:ornithine cyclodeaminase family protein [Novosphingobium chloroacetimidivorans]MBB4858660.1 ornithine cyclodeaminase/alanine dehydrogenase-like protein (mu-crystallin family) [Novosphingobium chloroacetimidivorans]
MANSNGPVFVSGEAVKQVFQWKDAVAALQAAYAQPLSVESVPPRTIAQHDRAWLRTLPAAPPGGRYFGTKLMGSAMASASPTVEYVIVLFDRETSRIAAFVDANALTGFRTAGTSAAALDRLAPEGPARLAVIGSGLEASMHTRAFASIRPLSEIRVFSPTPDRRAAFAEAAQSDSGVKATPVGSPEEAVEGADIVLAAARSHGEVPILYGDWIKPGATIVSIGSTVPSQREIDVSVVERADLIVCDMLEEVLHETGDMIAAKAAGIDVAAKSHSLASLLAGEIEPQRAAARQAMFKSVGSGLQDIVVASMVLERALAAGLTTPLPMTFESKSI